MQSFSKKSCLKFLAQLWDPIGLISPITIKFRIDLQGLWSLGYSWKDILPDSIEQKWLENVQSINDLLSFQFDRKLKPSNAVSVPQIHRFSDGTGQAYGAADVPAFSNTAMDMFGPVYIKLGYKTLLKEAQVAIFACMTSHAIHLEQVSDKTSDIPVFAGQTMEQI